MKPAQGTSGNSEPDAIAGFVNQTSGSLFPLVPWAGFTYAGILCAYFARNARSPGRELAWPFPSRQKK